MWLEGNWKVGSKCGTVNCVGPKSAGFEKIDSKSEAFQKFWFKNFSFLGLLFSQINAFQESMEKPTLTFLRWKMTQKFDFSTAIFRTNLDRLEKLLNSKQNVFPQKVSISKSIFW